MKKYHVVKSEKNQLGRFEIVLDTVLENGACYPYSYVSMKDSVGVLAFVDDNIILIKQYRHALGTYELEIPGGVTEDGENPFDAAIRETEEETGFKVERLRELGKYYPSPGSTNETCTLFLAECKNNGNKNTEPLEYAETVILKKEEFVSIIRDGTFRHSMGLVAWLYYLDLNGDETC